jgi:signal transduction histidine kinase
MTKKSQNALSESILRATLYSIGDAVIATDKRGRVTLMNPVAGKSYDEVTLANYLKLIVQNQKARPREVKCIFKNPVGMNVW